MRSTNYNSLLKTFPLNNASSLPPLRNTPGSRALNLELQKTRTAVMDSIQAESNSRARGNQQFESAISLAEHEFTPKIHTLERQSAFARKQLTGLMTQLTETQGTLIQNIKNQYETSKLQFEQQIKQDSVSKLNPILENQRLQASKIQKLTENIVSFLSKNADSIREVQNDYESVDKDISEFNKKSLSTVNEIQPRISVQESKVSFLENQTEEFMKGMTQIQDMKNTEKQLRDTLRQIEDDDIDAAVSQAAQETLQLISTKTTEIDQRIFETETNSTSLQGSLQSGKQSQDHQDAQVEDMSRKSMELDSLLKSDEEELIGKLVELQTQLDQIKTKIMAQIQEQGNSATEEMNFSVEDFEERVQRLSVLSSQDITQLAKDWERFTADNKLAQKRADEIIYDTMDKLQGQGNIMKRVAYQESRLNWCLQRLEYWERDDAKKKRAGIESGKMLAERIDELEQKIRDFESGLESADGQKAEVKEIEKTNKSVPIVALSELKEATGESRETKMDPSLVLTYPDDEPPFEPLKRTKEDEEIANKRLERIKQEKQKRYAQRIDDLKITEDFISQSKSEESMKPQKEEVKEEKVKERAAKVPKKDEDEEEDEEEEKKPLLGIKKAIAEDLEKGKKNKKEEDGEEDGAEEDAEEDGDEKKDEGNIIQKALKKKKHHRKSKRPGTASKETEKKKDDDSKKAKRTKSEEVMNPDEDDDEEEDN